MTQPDFLMSAGCRARLNRMAADELALGNARMAETLLGLIALYDRDVALREAGAALIGRAVRRIGKAA